LHCIVWGSSVYRAKREGLLFAMVDCPLLVGFTAVKIKQDTPRLKVL